MSNLFSNTVALRERIQRAAQECERDATAIIVVAVSKTHDANAIAAAYQQGFTHIGENYVQEAAGKVAQLASLPLIWHLLGPLQANKTRWVAEHCHWLHSLDRLSIAKRLHTQRPAQLPPLNVCLQVNIDGETSKAGLPIADVCDFTSTLLKLDRLAIRGLMVIPKPKQPAAQTLVAFQRAAACLRTLQAQFPSLPLDTLSMGMSADLELAIAAGSTMLRVGTDIFGARPQK